MESERSLVELRQRNDELTQDLQNAKTQIASLEQQVSQDAAHATAMQTKISSLELGSQLQVKHLESISAQEASLRQVRSLLVYAR
jgi:FtsZ-binding cell division protein ZapB